MHIGSRELSAKHPYIIAEAGVNHNGDIVLAKKLVDAAHAARADAVKFQTFTPAEMVTEHAAQAAYQEKNIGTAEPQSAMLKKLSLSHDQFRVLKTYAEEIGIEFLSTPFSIPDADFLHTLDLAAYKISSGDLTNIPLLEHVADFGKPVLLSTGMATLEEIRESFGVMRQKGAEVVILQCTSEYPTPLASANLRVLETFAKEFQVLVGFSDHTEGIDASVYASSLGAVVIEKHFTLDKALPGPDHKASLEPQELKKMIGKIRATKEGALSIPAEALGRGEKNPTSQELVTKKLVRKGIVTRTDIKNGQRLTKKNILIARPEGPIRPKELSAVLGKKAACDIAAGTSLMRKMISWKE